MPKTALTARVVATAKHDPENAGNQTFTWDTKLGGFALAVSETGRKSYIIQYRAVTSRAG